MWFFKKQCEHIFGPVNKDGYQYCTKCNFAVFIPRKCEHIFEKFADTKDWWTEDCYKKRTMKGQIFHDRCGLCGRIRITRTNIDKETTFDFDEN
jgi:hypothetical protein